MKQLAPLALVAALAVPLSAAAQDSGEDGFSLMEEGAKLLLRGFAKEMEPAIKDLQRFTDEIEPGLRSFVDEMGPALAEMMGKIDDITAYHAPEMLPNGDIIIRRKVPLVPEEGPRETPGEEVPEPGEEIDL